jgi:hypothetical protein
MGKFFTIEGPISWEYALECAQKGRGDLLALLVSTETIPAQLRGAVAQLLASPPAPAQLWRGIVTRNDATEIRGIYKSRMTARAGRRKPLRKNVLPELATELGLKPETLRDIIEERNTYAAPENGGEIKKSPRKKSVRRKKSV